MFAAIRRALAGCTPGLCPKQKRMRPRPFVGDLGDANGPGPGTPFAARLLDNSADPEAVPKCEFDTALQ